MRFDLRTTPRWVLGELFARQRTLAGYGMLLMALTAVALLGQLLDPRTIDDVNVWVKPAKFLFSVAIFSLTFAWFFGYVRPERRGSWTLRAVVVVLVAAGTVELAYISWQAAHALASHFNRSSTFYEIMYALMGVAAVLLVGTTLPLAWEIARRPASGLRPDFVASVVVGLVLCFVLGGGLGGYMSQQAGHSVGAVGGTVPIVGWNRSGGDLRAAHFLGIHAQQAIPVIGTLIGGIPRRFRWPALVIGAVMYVGIAVAFFAQALAGQPLMPL